MAPTYGHQDLEIEQMGSDISIHGVVRKFGFANNVDDGNWIVPVSRLRESLACLR
jgi:hypothetical protein